MKKQAIITLLLFLVAMAGQAKNKTIVWNEPAKALNRADLLLIHKVELTKQETRLYARYYYMPGYWFSIAKESYLQSGGKTYPIVCADSITLGERFTLGNNGSQEFVLHFEPLPVKTKEFDFLEGLGDGDFKVFGIHDSTYTMPAAPVPAEYRADYALLPYIGYLAATIAGADWQSEILKYDRLVKELTGVAPSERPLPTALLVVWVGRGSDRTLGGEFGEKRFVRKGSIRGTLDALTVNAGGVGYASHPRLADLNFQATTRGGRVMDRVLDRKATAKRGLAASANVLLACGAACFSAGAESGNLAFAAVMFSAGGLCVALGGPTPDSFSSSRSQSLTRA